MNESTPDIRAVLTGMSQSMGKVPPAIASAAPVALAMVVQQGPSSALAMPPENGALDPETTTRIGGRPGILHYACALAMANKAKARHSQ
ncbi:MAG TPA: hypothetical protein VMV23_09015 [Candidatus Nanopelagicaceae bacterium]|nr:hypothetical protein [Candidatus Nanopelagicaceae bacterium]